MKHGPSLWLAAGAEVFFSQRKRKAQAMGEFADEKIV
jgi:hypothetical protein